MIMLPSRQARAVHWNDEQWALFIKISKRCAAVEEPRQDMSVARIQELSTYSYQLQYERQHLADGYVMISPEGVITGDLTAKEGVDFVMASDGDLAYAFEPLGASDFRKQQYDGKDDLTQWSGYSTTGVLAVMGTDKSPSWMTLMALTLTRLQRFHCKITHSDAVWSLHCWSYTCIRAMRPQAV